MLTRRIKSCKAHKARISTAGVALASCLALTGCATVTVESQSFRTNNASNVESAEVAIDADFSQYRNLLATELGIYFPESQLTTAEDVARIRESFRTAFLAELEGYPIVNEPGPETMAVEASLVDMRNASASEIPQMRSSIREMAQPGTILFLMELRDSQTERVLARAADSASAPSFSTAAGTETDWDSIEKAAQRWAALFRVFLDENFAR